jgi:hypothetical protein
MGHICKCKQFLGLFLTHSYINFRMRKRKKLINPAKEGPGKNQPDI